MALIQRITRLPLVTLQRLGRFTVLLFVILLAATPAPHSHLSPHREHASEAVLLEDDGVLRGRIRFFARDLQTALRHFHDDPSLRLAASEAADDRFIEYLAARFVLTQDETPLRARVVASGEDTFGHHRLWWYEIVFGGYHSGGALHLHNTLLFDHFADQKNRVVLRRAAREAEQAYIFTPTDDRFTLVP